MPIGDDHTLAGAAALNALLKPLPGQGSGPVSLEAIADRLLDARRMVERDFAMPLTVQRLARRARLPHQSFNSAYHAAFGVAPMDHVRQLRLQEAARLLMAGLPVAEIAARVGYPNPAVFRAAFRQVFRDDSRMRARLDLALKGLSPPAAARIPTPRRIAS